MTANAGAGAPGVNAAGNGSAPATNGRLVVVEANGTKVPQPGQAVYDIGDVILESLKRPIRHDFVIRNNSNADTIIDGVRPECECTSAVLLGGSPGAPYVLHPGEKATVGVSINPKLLGPGLLDKSTTIFLAGQKDPVLTLHITGNVKSASAYTPASFYFGNVPIGSSPSTSFMLELDRRFYKENAPDPVCDNPNFTLVRNTRAKLPARPGKIVRQYVVRVSPRGNLGFRQGVFAMPDKIGSLAASEFAVAASVTGQIESDVTAVSFGIVKVKTTNTQDVPIQSANPAVLSGLKVLCASKDLHAEILPPSRRVSGQDAETAILRVAYTPVKLGTFQSQIEITTPSGQVLALPVWATVRDTAEATNAKPTPDVLLRRSER